MGTDEIITEFTVESESVCERIVPYPVRRETESRKKAQKCGGRFSEEDYDCIINISEDPYHEVDRYSLHATAGLQNIVHPK